MPNRLTFLLIPALVVCAVLGASCERLPDATLRQTDLRASTAVRGDSLFITFTNPAPIPTRIEVSSKESDVDERVRTRLVLEPSSETVVALDVAGLDSAKVRSNLSFSFTFGSLDTPVRPVPLAWPFPRGRSYEVIQGYEGSFSHTSAYSRYALDFNLAEGDTISAADDGWVVGVIEGYDVGGDDPKYRPYANYITVYHPHSGVVTQYVHLLPGGSFVAVGDSVGRGQPLGRAGLTGFTNIQHLHFNVLVADSTEGMVSIPVTFENGTAGESLRQRDRVGH
ncbi:MAG: M23 family metallopeptidase [Rhodothermales bacterium]